MIVSLSRIRNRAGMPDVDITVYNSQEKLRELALEERRRRTAEIVLNRPAEGAVDPATGKAVVAE